MPQLDEYKQAIVNEYTSSSKNIFVNATAGCLGKDVEVLMFDGSTKLSQNIRIGDVLMGPDSCPRKVLMIKTGVSNLYEVSPNKGEKWICNDEHIFTVHDQYITRSMKLYNSGKTSDIVDKHIKDILKFQRNDNSIGHLKLVRASVEFKETKCSIDPYLLGVWLSEGTKHKGSPYFSICKQDSDIINYLLDYPLPEGIECKMKDDSENCVQVRFVGKGSKNIFREEFKKCIDEYGNIFIPKNYLINSKENRLRLLAGLLDGDGYLKKDGCCFSISTKWESLGKGIIYLVRSLGLFPSYKWKRSTIKSRNFEAYYFRIGISGHTEIIPNILSRKKAKERKQIKNVLHTGFSLKLLGKGEWFGFTVDGDNRYLLGDFTITHNSGKTFTLCELSRRTPPVKSSIFMAFNKSIAEELQNRLPPQTKASTLHSYALSSLRKAFNFDFQLSDSKNFKFVLEHIKFPHVHVKRIPGLAVQICRLYDLMRFNLVGDDIEALISLGERYGEDVDEQIAEKTIELHRLNRKAADNYFLKGYSSGKLPIDFTDMLYYAVKYIDDADFKRYNVVMLDECLPYEIPVICENGQHIPIGKIVEDKLPVRVLTFNHETGQQEFKRVINFSRTFNTKRCIKINAVQNKKHGERSFITCTFNHKIWVKDRGYVYAEDVHVGDVIQFETSAIKTQKYRVSPNGKMILSGIMNKKNNSKEFRDLIPKRKGLGGICQGGNGRINDIQMFLHSKLNSNDSWVLEGIIVPGETLSKKYSAPNHYKVDILSEKLKVAIELDGGSHLSKKRKEQDKRKELCLEELGYKVIRIKNRQLLQKFEEIVDAINNHQFCYCFNGEDCPVYLTVTSVMGMDLNEKYVYDITVEDNHNFYANGILVHNCQDISPLQFELVKRCKTPRGRLIAVGDEKQSIYSFMGSNLDSLHAIKSAPNTVSLPLSMTYRCARNIVDEACTVFPNSIVAAPGAQEGVVGYKSYLEANDGDFILCRNNSPLVKAFIDLLRQGKKCSILGKEYGEDLVRLIDSVNDIFGLEQVLTNFQEKLKAKGVKNPERNESYGTLEEKVHVLLDLWEYFGNLESVRDQIKNIFVENQNRGILLSTVHKSKGLEADRVFFLEPDLIPSKFAVTELALYAEKCLKFVAITRARRELYYCYLK